MEFVIKSIMDTLIVILNYQPMLFFGIGIRVIHLVLFYFLWKMWKNK